MTNIENIENLPIVGDLFEARFIIFAIDFDRAFMGNICIQAFDIVNSIYVEGFVLGKRNYINEIMWFNGANSIGSTVMNKDDKPSFRNLR